MAAWHRSEPMTERQSRIDLSNEPVERLIELLTSGLWTQKVLARIELLSRGEEALPALVECLRSPHREVRWEAAKALSTSPMPAAIPALLDALEDDDGGVRWLASEALAKIGEPAVIPVLRRLLERSNSPWFQEGAHHVLQKLVAPEFTSVVDALEHAFPAEAIPPEVDKALRRLEGNR
ncbi:MAG: hypothetical protein Kow0010_26210 [Dehalococcoidia bacterium]